MLKIGLTGGIASGKSALAKLFTQFGVTVINLDEIARDVVQPDEPALLEIAQHFGDAVLNTDGSLNRKHLRKEIFDSPHKREWLESLLHPLIRTRQNEQVQKASSDYVLIEIPLLAERQLQNTVDRVLVVDTPRAVQINRAVTRDHVLIEDIEKILDTQASREERLAIADDVIRNDGKLADLHKQAEKLHENYIKLAKVHTNKK